MAWPRQPGDVGPRRAPWRWSRSPFFVHMLLIASFLAVALLVIAFAFYHFAQRPRAQMLASMYAAQIASVSAATHQLPPGMRADYLGRLETLSDGSVLIDDPAGWRFAEPPNAVGRDFLIDVRRRLPDHRIEFSVDPSVQLWAEITPPGERGRWIRMPLSRYTSLPSSVLLAGLLTIVLVTLGGTRYLVARSRRKLSWLGEAIDQIGASPSPGATAQDAEAPDDTDLADLRSRFNEMSVRLAEAHADRALMLAGVSHDMRTLLTKLRLCLALDPPTSGLAAPVRYIEHMDRIIGQFVEFARPVEEEPRALVNLNHVVAEVAADFAPDGVQFALTLGAVPSCALRPLAVRRMAMNLIENAVRHGRSPIEITTALEESAIVLRVLDRGPGVSVHELENLARPFFRTVAARGRSPGSGLGLAISRRMAEAHGGTLLLALRNGGGFHAEIRLPVAACAPG